MVRREKREAERLALKLDKSIMMKQSDINELILRTMEATRKEVNAEIVKALVASFAMSLNDEFGFSTKRIARVLERTKKKYDDILTDHLTQEDVYQWCEENNIEII